MLGSNESLAALAVRVDQLSESVGQIGDGVHEAQERAERIETKLMQLVLSTKSETACLAFSEIAAARGALALPA